MSKYHLSVISTLKDASLPLLFTDKLKHKYHLEVTLVEELLKNDMPHLSTDVFYCRDPFNNTSVDQESLEAPFSRLFKAAKFKYSVDQIYTFNDLLIEDKWKQYGMFKSFMPHTQLLKNPVNTDQSIIIKKRISSRGRGIFFSTESFTDKDYATEGFIYQERLSILREYRVMVVKDEILNLVATKTSKDEERSVRIDKITTIPSKIKDFCETVMSHSAWNFDLVGLDIAETTDGNIYLLEINRSPQFSKYFSLTGINPFELLLDRISAKLPA